MRGNSVIAGMLLGVAAYALFALNDATNKYLVTYLPVAQALFFRSLTITLGCLAVGRTQAISATIASVAFMADSNRFQNAFASPGRPPSRSSSACSIANVMHRSVKTQRSHQRSQ